MLNGLSKSWMSMTITSLVVPLQRNNMVVSFLNTAKDVHGCVSTAAQCDTGLSWSEQKEMELLNLRE